VVDSGHAVRMTRADEPSHPFLLIAVDCFEGLGFISASKRICVFELDSIALELEILFRVPAKFEKSSADNPFFFLIKFAAIEERCQGDFFGGCDWNIGHKWK
jgi:hypothetical protein